MCIAVFHFFQHPYLPDTRGGCDGVEEVLAGGGRPQLHVELGLVRRHRHVQVSLKELINSFSLTTDNKKIPPRLFVFSKYF